MSALATNIIAKHAILAPSSILFGWNIKKRKFSDLEVQVMS